MIHCLAAGLLGTTERRKEPIRDPPSNAQDVLLFDHHVHGDQRYHEKAARVAEEGLLMGQSVPRPLLATMALLFSATMLAGCGAIVADHLPTVAGGLPEGVPDRPTKQTNFPAVHDMPPPRASTVLTDTEQKKLEDDLIAARTRTGAAAKAGTRDD
jgi:hypothetical protein